MEPKGKKIITYKFEETEGATLSIKDDKVYYLYSTVDPETCGRTLIASKIEQVLICVKRVTEISELDYKFNYYGLIAYFENTKDNKTFCIFEVEKVKINPYMGVMYVYLK